ncbi:transposase [Bifidobacterium adolescentis]|nr:transposase [Bifidobacterium adolescentis]KAB5672127.1 transposase [Bifidobacterium adolescentis]KAB5707637.1 transposase [Bifidobacterium adolescentis]KAB5709431.1 transposase [Bifidobacterium adolescentis]
MIRANAARYPISARCGIPGVPRSACYWMTGHPEAERADPIAGDVRAVRRDGRERHGARKIKAALERKGVTASRRRIGDIMREQGMTGAYARGRSEPHRTRADEAGLANLPDPRVRRLRPAHASGGRPDVCEGRERMGVRVSAGRPGEQGHRRPFRRADPGREPGIGRVRHPRLPADGRPGNRGLPAGRVRRPLFPYSDVRRQQHAGGSCERDGTNQRRVPRGGRAIRGARRHNRRRAWNDEKRLARFRRTVDSRNGMRRNGLRNGLPAGPRRARSYC